MSLQWQATDGVASKGHDAWGSSILVSHFNLDQNHLLQMLDNLNQRSAWWNQNPSFGSDCTFLLARVQIQLDGWSNIGSTAYNLVHCVPN